MTAEEKDDAAPAVSADAGTPPDTGVQADNPAETQAEGDANDAGEAGAETASEADAGSIPPAGGDGAGGEVEEAAQDEDQAAADDGEDAADGEAGESAVDIRSVDPIEFAAATAHMTAARLFALLAPATRPGLRQRLVHAARQRARI